MSIKLKITGEKILMNYLKQLGVEAKKPAQAYVSYEAHYAIYVHENLDAFHPNGQAKFIEQPAREYRHQIASRMVAVYLSTRSLSRSLRAGATYLLNLSKELVPVDTGYLKSTGKVVMEKY